MNNEKLYNLQPIKQRYGIIGNSDGLNRALDIAIQVANTDLSVLVEGENGVGKEVFPKIIHDNSARKHQKYFAINCGSIPSGTIESELFGHIKGSFTGAVSDHAGYFETANKGTLFLDEVGELPLEVQVKLLRVLETGEFIRMGSNEIRKTDVRIVAATNVMMSKAIKEGKFREDLYYRLATIPISVPPLRERGDDIILLFRKFSSEIAEKYHIEPLRLTSDARELMLSYKWPGNIRQLRNIVENLSITSREREIDSRILSTYHITDDRSSNSLPVVISHEDNGKHSYASEREILLAQLVHLNKEIQDLKKMVNEIAIGKPDLKDPLVHQDIPVSEEMMVYPDYSQSPSNYSGLRIKSSPSHKTSSSRSSSPSYSPHEDVEYAKEYVDEMPLTIEEQYKQRVREALKRNNYNRKKTSEELGISERTLYRKIIKFGLNEDE
jgi:transcriptional regulator with PAS, ATPase and Fis domain